MLAEETQGRSGFSAAVARAVTLWALLGGVLLLAVVLLNVGSVVGSVFWRAFPGDFELTEMGVAIAVFAFVPYCQLTDANVTADIFTSRAPPRLVAVFRALASVIAFGFAVILVWRMYLGMLDQREYDYTTTILQVPIWWASLPILISLLLLIAAAWVTLVEAAKDTAR